MSSDAEILSQRNHQHWSIRMFDKLSIGIVGATDFTTRLYNLGSGFAGMVGSISFGAADSVYLGFTSERAYVVAVEGDLAVCTETSDEGHKVDGVFGFDLDWSDAAKARGCGIGTLFMTNPDDPKKVSMFTVRMDAAQSVAVKFDSNTGFNARAVVTEATDIGKLDREILRVLSGGQPTVDSSAVRRALKDGSARPAGFIPQDVSDLWRGADVERLRRNILT